MKEASDAGKSVLMIAYTNYRTDPRVIRAAEAAVQAGFDVDFLALRREVDPDVEVIGGVRVIHLHQYRYRGGGLLRYMLAYLQFFVRCFFKATCLHLQKRYRVIHVNNIPDFLVFCTIVPRLMGARVILDIHDPMPNTFASKFKGGEHGFYFKLLLWQELASARYADQVITVHDPLKDLVLVKHGLPADSIRVIANFADGDLFRLRPDYEADGKLRMIFHGTILERYGLRTLLEAISKVESRDKISLRIIGEGDFSEELAGLIVSLKVGDIVKFENRIFPLHQIPEIIGDANLGLVPLEISSITNYAVPLKLLEYISMGLPVVTVRNAAIGYYFGDDDCLFYKPDDMESLRVLIDRVANDRDLLRRYRQKSIVLRDKFLWSNEKQKYIALLGELARRN
jgi:glycosyltransferase involved in cell wall biosynthesis